MPAAKLSTLSSSSRKLEEEEEVVYFRLRVYNYKLSSIYVLTRVCVNMFGWWVSQNTHKYKRWEIIFCNKNILYMFTLHVSTYLIISFLNCKPRIKLLLSIVNILSWFFESRIGSIIRNHYIPEIRRIQSQTKSHKNVLT